MLHWPLKPFKARKHSTPPRIPSAWMMMNGDDGDGQQLVIDCKEQTALNRPVQLWFTIASQQGYPRPLVRGESNTPENTRGLQTESPPPYPAATGAAHYPWMVQFAVASKFSPFSGSACIR